MRSPLAVRPRGQKPALLLVLAVAALTSFSLFGAIAGDGLHPLGLLVSLLPLQLAALLWAFGRAGRP